MVKRACGANRVDGGLYLAIPTSPFGKDISYFLIDPCKIVNLKPFRTPIIVERKDGSKISDIIVYIGKQFYPFVSDFLEESRLYGISRRIPKSFPFERLTPFESRMFFIHERAIPLFEYDTGRECPRKIKHSHKPGDTCVFDLWHLSALESMGDKHAVSVIDADHVAIQTPSVRYSVNIPRLPAMKQEQKTVYKYQMGVFAAFFVSHLEFISKKKKKMPESLKKRIKETDFDIKVMEE